MVDLIRQYEDIKEEVNASIDSILQSATFINGPKVHEFQAKEILRTRQRLKQQFPDHEF